MDDETNERRKKIIKILMMKEYGNQMIEKEIKDKKDKIRKEQEQEKEPEQEPEQGPEQGRGPEQDSEQLQEPEPGREIPGTGSEPGSTNTEQRKYTRKRYDKQRNVLRFPSSKKQMEYNIIKDSTLDSKITTDSNNEDSNNQESVKKELDKEETNKGYTDNTKRKNVVDGNGKRTIKRKKLFFHVKDINMRNKMSKTRFIPNKMDTHVSEYFRPYEKEKIVLPNKRKSIHKKINYELNNRGEDKIKKSRKNFLDIIKI